ncbi:MAG: hypothetical protein Q7W44_02580 [Coriobacteriia bacterium]|nr:hypothetical protein [Coriobacteriia bacterium]
MRHRWLIHYLTAILVAVPSAALAAPVASGELIEHPEAWDGETITFTGEAIGESMVRGSEAWLHVNDDAYADASIASGAAPVGYNSGHAVVAPPEIAEVVRVFGDHRHQGDLIEVTGVFNAACSQHGGDMDVHAHAIRIVRPGAETPETLDRGRLIALALVALGAAVLAGRLVLVRARR